jgi:cell division protein FtsB
MSPPTNQPSKQPRRAPTGRRGSRPGRPRQRLRARSAAPARVAPLPEPRRSRFTGRAMVLVLVLSVLTISYASSLKAYFQQHSQIEDLRSQIASSQSSISKLEDEKARWSDPAYVREQARARFGYLMPGQTSYVVIGEDGKPLAAQSTLSDPRTSTSSTPTAWWTTEWRSVQLAGNPPATKPKQKPLKYLGGHHQ